MAVKRKKTTKKKKATSKKRKNKYNYYKFLQQNNGYGWDDVEHFETKSDFKLTKEQKKEMKYLKQEYKIAQPKASLRVVSRKVDN